MDATDVAQVSALVGALATVLVLAAGRRSVLAAGFALLAAAEAGLVGSLAGSVSLRSLVTPAALALGAIALAGAAGATLVLVRYPALVTPLVLAAAPFRLPLDFGREHRFFVAVAEPGQLGRLLPLYAVLGAAILALLVRALRERTAAPLPAVLAYPVAAFIGFAALSLLWTDDLRAGTNLLAYFLLPFAALIAVVGRAPFPAWLPRALASVAVALAALFAAVGLLEVVTGQLLFYAPNLEVSNSYASFFRVTSLFRDPSLYGRHVVLGIAVLLVALWLRRIHVAWAAALIALLWIGLFFSYSQSSFVALFVVTLAVTATEARERTIRLIVAAIAALVLLVAGGLVAASAWDESPRKVTSDRSRRVELAASVYADRPVAGVGLGAQPYASQQRSERFGPVQNFVSHTAPLTVAAELGTIGLLLYAVLLAAAVKLLAAVRRGDEALGVALAAVFLALFVHALFYSGFFEDPITWLVLGVAASYLVARRTTGGAATLSP